MKGTAEWLLVFTELCTCHHDLISERFHRFRNIEPLLTLPSPRAPAYFLSVDLLLLNISYKWDHIRGDLLAAALSIMLSRFIRVVTVSAPSTPLLPLTEERPVACLYGCILLVTPGPPSSAAVVRDSEHLCRRVCEAP